MRSIEGGRRHDLDQVDPEHMNKIERENSWNSVKNVPFRGEESLLDSINRILGEDDDVSEEERLEKARRDALAAYDKAARRLETPGSFGRGARTTETTGKIDPKELEEAKDMNLSDISATF